MTRRPPAVGQWELDLPYETPPLSQNDRGAWQVRARKIAKLRKDTAHMARFLGLPQGLGYVEVILHYRPNVRRPRDEDNLFATLKPALDGLRDAGVIEDDDHTHVTSRCRIEPVEDSSRLWLTITDLTLEGP